MKIKLNFPPQGEKDGFSHDLANAELFFKLIGWLVLIGTLQYAGAATDRGIFTFWAFGLTLELCYLAMSFCNNRIYIEVVDYDGNRPVFRRLINLVFAGIVGFMAWQLAYYTIKTGVDELVAFNKRGQQVNSAVTTKIPNNSSVDTDTKHSGVSTETVPTSGANH